MDDLILAIDQGTTNSRAILFNSSGNHLAQHEMDLDRTFPNLGWVEQNPEEMLSNTIICCGKVIEAIPNAIKRICAVGISNQRETTIIWDKKTGKAIYPAIVWQDRRTNTECEMLKSLESLLTAKTGLIIDPYFSATKIMWILENVPNARQKAEQGDLLFGTVDTYLIWQLSKGQSHVTDATNASRTMLFNIHTQAWDKEILTALAIPASLLPEVKDSAANFGMIAKEFFGENLPITGVAGDQQAATVGQTCFLKGQVKVTFGTGGFIVLNTGHEVVKSHNKLLTTIAYRLQNKPTYALEGGFFSAGATIKWLRDNLKLIQYAADSEALAASIQSCDDVYLVPAFIGLGAPHWIPEARACITGLTFSSQPAHIVRAALESIVYQTKDLLTAMLADSDFPLQVLRVDGGMVANQWLLQFLANILNITIERSQYVETTALGAAFLAGMGIGLYASFDDIMKLWHNSATYTPAMGKEQRDVLYSGWKRAIASVTSFSTNF